jgi:hypothetical protein
MDPSTLTPKPSTTTSTSDAKTIAAGRRQAEELLDLIERRKRRIMEDFYDIGVALRTLLRKKLYAALGYDTFGKLLVARKVMSRTSAAKLMTIVSVMSRDRALPLGSERAFVLAQLVVKAKSTTTVDEILERGLAVAGKLRPIGEVSLRDLRRLVRDMREPSPPKPRERDAINAARRAQTALRRTAVLDATARPFRRQGRWHLQIEMPVASVEPFLERFRD